MMASLVAPGAQAFWQPWNTALFEHMHATAGSPPALLTVAAALAEWLFAPPE